jgi:lysophospholipase L1-like esterase
MRFGPALLLACIAGGSPQLMAAQEPSRDELEQLITTQRRQLNDWAGLTRYGSDNTELKLPENENRVVFLGDEITENWGQGGAKFFPGKPYINRGIAQQTTPQMLVRFRQDVIGLKPKAVVIQAGLNDIAGAAGPITEGMAAENFMSMVELAKANGIRVVIASLTPVCDCFRNLSGRRPAGKILSLNGWLKDYAARSGAVYLNYYSALAAGRAMSKDLTIDGMVPNDAGYEKMAVLAEKAISEALGQK